MSDRVREPQVPARRRLVYPACGRLGGQTVRILCRFSAYQMLYCAEIGDSRPADPGATGNRLKSHLQPIEIQDIKDPVFFHKEILDTPAPRK
jgi:hypothetical protein